MDAHFVKGVIPPIVTPVDTEEKVIEQSLRQIIEHVIVGGVHGILSMGSNGEFFGFNHEEQQRAVAITVAQVQGRVPVYMGIGAISTRECVSLAKKAEQLDVQAITILPPMFLTPSEDELYHHFKAVADATSLPVLLYNNPDRMRVGISAGLLERLAAIPNIVGAKDSSGDMTLTAEFIRRTRDSDFKIMAGRDIMILATLAYGGVGCVASTANIVPRLVVEIYDKFMAGDMAGSLEAQYKLAPLRMAYNLGSFPVVTKDYMKLLGFDVGAPIKPNSSCSPDNMARLKALLEDIGAEKLA
jgi:4-hydroxy-tetrahydrodipicolinate synthase